MAAFASLILMPVIRMYCVGGIKLYMQGASCFRSTRYTLWIIDNWLRPPVSQLRDVHMLPKTSNPYCIVYKCQLCYDGMAIV